MLRKILKYGAIAGVIVGGTLFTSTVLMHGHPPSLGVGALIGYSAMLIALSAIFFAIKNHRDEVGGGVIKFLPALGIGLGVSAVAGVFYVIAWEAALNVTGMDFAAEYGAAMLDQKKSSGASEEEIARFAVEIEKMQQQYANPMFRVPMTFLEIFPVGVLISLFSAALLRNPRLLPRRKQS